MMARKNLTCLLLNNLSSLYKPHFYFSIPMISYTTSIEMKPSENPTISQFLIREHQFSPQVASRVASFLTESKNPEKIDSVLSFLKQYGLTHTQLEKIARIRPELFVTNVEKIIKPKINIFQEFGFSDKLIAEIISKSPVILLSSVDKKLLPSLSVIRGLLGSTDNVAKVLRSSAWFLATDLEKNLVPNMKFLKSCGISTKQIIMHIYHLPRFLLLKPEIVKKCVATVDKMGVNRSSKMFIYAVGVVGSMSSNGTFELKLQAFRNLGFSEDDILKAFKKTPLVFSVSEEKMYKVKEILVSTGKYKTSCIIKHPLSLMYSIEKRYKPRLRVLKTLESRQVITSWPSLLTLYRLSEEQFYDEFVWPYLDVVGKIYKS